MASTQLFYVCLMTIFGAALGETPGGLSECRRFEYEFGVLHDMVQLKINQTRLESQLQQHEAVTASLTTQLQVATSTISNLQSMVADLERRRATSDSTYVRWGRRSCPGNGNNLVYSGYTGGSHETHQGGAAEYICLPTDPEWGHYESAAQVGGFVYGAEYELNYGRTRHQDFFPNGDGTSLANHEVPCAVCLTSTKTTSLMIPGRKTCYAGWKVEYSGYLSSGYYGHAAASEYICVDESPEITNGSKTSSLNGKLLYMVEARTGSLPSPPFYNGRELTCVVCSIDERRVSP